LRRERPHQKPPNLLRETVLNILLYVALLGIAFFILSKSADIFVDSAVAVAETLRVPKMVIGIVLVGFATTAPEFAVSVQSAYLGHPEIALGNAVGSVICDDGLAVALAAVVASTPIVIDKRVLKSAGIFLLFVYGITYAMAVDGILGRVEGLALVGLLAGYIGFVFVTAKRETSINAALPSTANEHGVDTNPVQPRTVLRKSFTSFALGLLGVVISSRLIIWSCLHIAAYFHVPEVVIGLTVIAIGTSIPEIGTCIAAARKGQGEIAAGDIIGADILNILWIIGVSSLVNPMQVSRRIIHFMFPWMLVIVITMLISMRIGYRMGKPKGIILLSLYGIYMLMTIRFFY
jgi:cation:H+ antiporter